MTHAVGSGKAPELPDGRESLDRIFGHPTD